MRYSLISFDLDGTLVETASEIAEAANRTLTDFDIERQPLELISGFIGAGTRQMMLRLLAHVLLERPQLAAKLPTEQVLERLDFHYGVTAGTMGRPYPGCDEALSRLRDHGVRLACLTNKEKRFAKRVLDGTNLRRHFDLVVGGDSLPQRKPHPSTMDHVLQVLAGERHRAAHVGDSRIDVETARNAGVAAWAVPWGYNGGEPIVAAGPQRVFASFAAIAEHVIDTNIAAAAA
jgi:phosphoglycolate phosphatase